MSNKKYQVFVSSTYTDLINERQKILETLLRADCIPTGMEAFVATDCEQFNVIKKVIDLCDYYILIIGKRYGSINTTTGISYTEMEYDYAIEKGIPILVFAIDDSIKLADFKEDIEHENIDKLNNFRSKALKNRLATIWKTTDELTSTLALAITNAKNKIKRPGWQRAVDYDEASLLGKIKSLQNENNILKNEKNNLINLVNSFKEQTNLAFKNCSFKFEYSYFNKTNNKFQIENKSIELIDLFKVISIQLLDIANPEDVIKKIIINKFFPDSKYHHFNLNDNQVIKRILLQLKALGLINSQFNQNNSFLC
jgi:hypothetical protein